jgi:hypothetical protein
VNETDDRAAWMSLTLHAPNAVVEGVLELLKNYGFRDISPIDWCVMEREQDFAHVDYAPAEVGVNQYAVDWRRGEGRGDVPVQVEGERS